MDFYEALMRPDIPFLRYALAAGLLGSVAFGISGTYIVVRRISYIAGAISHSVLAGIGIGLYLQRVHGVGWIDPMSGALVFAILAALVIGSVSLMAREREDTVIGAIWATGMALGLLFLSITPGPVDPMSYLFGNILLVGSEDVLFILLADLLIVAMVLTFYNKFFAVCYDEEYARIRSIRVEVYYLLLLCMIALTIVLMVSIVGIVLVIALLTLPAAIASLFSRKLWQMMVISSVLCALFSFSGLWISYMTDLPAGPVIILVAGIIYVGVITAKTLFSNLLRGV
jgi:zinc transport system permease protein